MRRLVDAEALAYLSMGIKAESYPNRACGTVQELAKVGVLRDVAPRVGDAGYAGYVGYAGDLPLAWGDGAKNGMYAGTATCWTTTTSP
jgi:hypothetical protein